MVYWRRKWGIRVRPGSSTNAGNVMRLKQQKTTVKPREALESHAVSCFMWVSPTPPLQKMVSSLIYLGGGDSLYEH